MKKFILVIALLQCYSVLAQTPIEVKKIESRSPQSTQQQSDPIPSLDNYCQTISNNKFVKEFTDQIALMKGTVDTHRAEYESLDTPDKKLVAWVNQSLQTLFPTRGSNNWKEREEKQSFFKNLNLAVSNCAIENIDNNIFLLFDPSPLSGEEKIKIKEFLSQDNEPQTKLGSDGREVKTASPKKEVSLSVNSQIKDFSYDADGKDSKAATLIAFALPNGEAAIESTSPIALKKMKGIYEVDLESTKKSNNWLNAKLASDARYEFFVNLLISLWVFSWVPLGIFYLNNRKNLSEKIISIEKAINENGVFLVNGFDGVMTFTLGFIPLMLGLLTPHYENIIFLDWYFSALSISMLVIFLRVFFQNRSDLKNFLIITYIKCFYLIYLMLILCISILLFLFLFYVSIGGPASQQHNEQYKDYMSRLQGGAQFTPTLFGLLSFLRFGFLSKTWDQEGLVLNKGQKSNPLRWLFETFRSRSSLLKK